MLKSRRKRGFTLIELLVVIAIIALLLSIIVPSLKKAKSHAQRVVDFTNLRSLSLALQLYLNSNDDRFFEYDPSFLWMSEVGHMVDNIDEVRYCPKTIPGIQDVENDFEAQPGAYWGYARRPWLWAASQDPAKQYQLGSYGLNGWLYSKPSNPQELNNFRNWVPQSMENNLFERRSNVTSPSRTPFILDAVWVDGWPLSTNVLPASFNYDEGLRTGGGANNIPMMGRYVSNRHGGETHVILMDGQVKSIPLAELWALSWHRGYQPRYDVQLPQPVPTGRD